MRRQLYAISLGLAVLLSSCVSAQAQPKARPITASQTVVEGISLPDKVSGDPGAFIRVPATTTGAKVKWKSPDEGLNLFPVDLLKDTKTAVVIGSKPGVYRLWAWTIGKDGEPTDAAECLVTIGKPGPQPKPPGPKPPDPKPKPKPPDPKPPTPAPIPVAGLRVLVIYESADITKMPAAQQAIVYSEDMRDYLNSKCIVGPDGKTKEWRFWDQNIDTKNAAKLWQDVMTRPRQSIPWIVVSNGRTGFEGPMPASIDEAKKLIAKYEVTP